METVADPLAGDTYDHRYVFAPLDETTVSMDVRFNAIFTPTLTFEVYAQPFVSSGEYGPLMELAAPRTFAFHEYGPDVGTVSQGTDGTFSVDPDGTGAAAAFQIDNPNFNYRSLLGNAVLRWEFRPGSTLFLVWQQKRAHRLTPLTSDSSPRDTGSFDLDRDTRALFRIKPENILLIKVSYWLNP